MAEQVKADDSDVRIGSDSGSSEVVAKGGSQAIAPADLGAVESASAPEEPPPPPEPAPPPPSPLPMDVQRIATDTIEPGREAATLDQGREGLETSRGDQSFQALIDDIRRQYAGQGEGEPPPEEGTGAGEGNQQSQFASAVAQAKQSLQGARGETIEHENKRAGEFGTFLTDQRTAEQKRQDEFAAREQERIGLLNDWNKQLGDMKTAAETRSKDWGTFMGTQQATAAERQKQWGTFLNEASGRAQARSNEWAQFMHDQREAAYARQKNYEAFIADQRAKLAQPKPGGGGGGNKGGGGGGDGGPKDRHGKPKKKK